MHSASFSFLPNDLWTLIGTARAPQIVDVRRREIYDAAPGVLPAAPGAISPKIAQWSAELDPTRPVVLSPASMAMR